MEACMEDSLVASAEIAVDIRDEDEGTAFKFHP